MDEEPRLKYSRLTANLAQVLANDAISCLSVSNRFIAVGTHSGTIHLMDLMGTPVKEWKSHQSSITQISIDNNEEFLASSSGDGTVVVASLYTTEQSVHNYKRPVNGVQLERDYSKKTSKQFICGGVEGSLLLSKRGWFGNSTTTLDQGNGTIMTISWRNNYIVWANEKGIDVYDLTTSAKFGHVDKDPGPRPEIFKCNIVWVSDERFMYSWGDCVKVVDVLDRSQIDIGSGLSQKYLLVSHQFKTEFVVAGLAPFEGGIMLLAYIIDLAEFENEVVDPNAPKQKFEPPEIYIVDIDGTEIASDLLTIPGYELFHANDYWLEYLPGETANENSYYVVSPKDVILAKPRDIFDHVEWLVEGGKYADALEIVETNRSHYIQRLRDEAMLDIGLKYLHSLFVKKDFVTAALICPKILKTKDLWEEWVYKFADQHQIKSIYALIPIDNPVLSHSVYEMVLSEFLNTDLRIYLDIIQAWPSTIYSVETMIKAVEMNLDGANLNLVHRILMELCMKAQQYEKATYYGMLLREPGQVELIKIHNLINFLQSNVLLLLEYERDLIPKPMFENTNVVDPVKLIRDLQSCVGVELLITHTDHVPPSKVVNILQADKELLFVYLNVLFKKDPQESQSFQDMMVGLYADNDPERLIQFLRSAQYYSYPKVIRINKAYEICKVRDLIPEMMFLLGKMGDNRKALNLIIERLGDVEMAIDFAKEQNDDSLWEEFLKYAMDKPPFIVGLLKNLSAHIDPLRVIERIPETLDIPGLKTALVQIMSDCTVQLSLRNGCERILKSDTWNTLMQLIETQRKGLVMSHDCVCSTCGEEFGGENPKEHIVIFFCRHYFHAGCVDVVISYEDVPEADQGTTTVDRQIQSVYSKTSRTSSVARSQPFLVQSTSASCPLCKGEQ